MQKVAWIVAILLLAVTGVLGLKDGIADWNGQLSALQRSVTIGVLLYGDRSDYVVNAIETWRRCASRS